MLLLVTVTVMLLLATTEGKFLLETTDVMIALVMADDIRWEFGILDRWAYPVVVNELIAFKSVALLSPTVVNKNQVFFKHLHVL